MFIVLMAQVWVLWQNLARPDRTQHCVQPVAVFALQMTAVHPVIRLQVADDGFNRLAWLQLLSFLYRQTLGLSSMHHAYTRILGIDASVAQIDKDRFGRPLAVLHEDGGLLQLVTQIVAPAPFKLLILLVYRKRLANPILTTAKPS